MRALVPLFKGVFIPVEPQQFLFYYAAFLVLALVLFVRKRPRKGMRLRLRGRMADGEGVGSGAPKPPPGGLPGDVAEKLGHVSAKGERPLNVVFNFNGHSWDAYEVLGLPAGSSPEKVEEAYRASVERVDNASKPFIDAAYQAIRSQWQSFKASSG